MRKEIRIPYCKSKIGLVFLGALTFVVLGIMILIDEEGYTSTIFKSEVVNKAFAAIGIIFFGTICVTIASRLFKTNMGIVINEKGIWDYSNLSSIGFIEWKDIEGIRIEKFKRTRFILIDTNNPEKYIDKANNKFKKLLLNLNDKKYKSPLSITSTILKIKFHELERLMMEAYEENKGAPQQRV
jgi:hypothetical protein